jgi:NTE family protein
MERRALVLGSGGNAAFAWQVGVIAGMAETGLDTRDGDAFVGTSAGARLAVQLASGVSPGVLLQTQLAPEPKTEPDPQVDLGEWRRAIARTKEGTEDRTDILRRMGSLSLATPTTVGIYRRESIDSLTSTRTWPSRRLLLVTVEAETGQRTVFDASSGIALLDAVVASGAVPGIFPPVLFRGHHYFDGGFYSTENADVARGYDRILILSLRSGNPPIGVVSLDESLERLRAGGAAVQVVHPDEATETAFSSVGGNVLDPAVAGPAARAGRLQGARDANGCVAALWR